MSAMAGSASGITARDWLVPEAEWPAAAGKGADDCWIKLLVVAVVQVRYLLHRAPIVACRGDHGVFFARQTICWGLFIQY